MGGRYCVRAQVARYRTRFTLLFELDICFGARELASDGRRAVHVSVGSRVIYQRLVVPLAAPRSCGRLLECLSFSKCYRALFALLCGLDMCFGARELASDSRRAVHVSVGDRAIYLRLGVHVADPRSGGRPVECPSSWYML